MQFHRPCTEGVMTARIYPGLAITLVGLTTQGPNSPIGMVDATLGFRK
jgi:hypothetical protein